MREELARELLGQMGQRVPDKLIQFGRALETYQAAGFEWEYFLEKPYKWSAEYTAWANLDYPQDDEEGWPEFVAAMEAIVGV